jgi:hypothetical protein
MSYFEICNKALHISLKEQEKIINELIIQLDALKKRVMYLEDTFLPIPENHEIFYEKVYVKNPMKNFPYVESIGILDNISPVDSISEGDTDTT